MPLDYELRWNAGVEPAGLTYLDKVTLLADAALAEARRRFKVPA